MTGSQPEFPGSRYQLASKVLMCLRGVVRVQGSRQWRCATGRGRCAELGEVSIGVSSRSANSSCPQWQEWAGCRSAGGAAAPARGAAPKFPVNQAERDEQVGPVEAAVHRVPSPNGGSTGKCEHSELHPELGSAEQCVYSKVHRLVASSHANERLATDVHHVRRRAV